MDILDLVDTVHDSETDDDVEDLVEEEEATVSWNPCAPSAFCASPIEDLKSKHPQFDTRNIFCNLDI